MAELLGGSDIRGSCNLHHNISHTEYKEGKEKMILSEGVLMLERRPEISGEIIYIFKWLKACFSVLVIITKLSYFLFLFFLPKL